MLSSKKLGDSYEGTLKNNYLYNGKELFEDADLGWYDYGFRNYDPQIGRFMQLDPLTYRFPFLTPYQYASCDPIANIDLDGLEGVGSVGGAVKSTGDFAYMSGEIASNVFTIPLHAAFSGGSTAGKAANIIGSAACKVGAIAIQTSNIINSELSSNQVQDDRLMISLRGSGDAILNNNMFGLPDYFGLTSHLDAYDDPHEQEAYLEGRLIGNGLVIAQSSQEITTGGGIMVAGLATGPGVVIISTSGALYALHGFGIGISTTYDASWAAAKLIELKLNMKTSNYDETESTNQQGNGAAGKADKPKSINQLNQEVQTGKAPKSIKRFDKGRGTPNLPEDEVHFDDGSSLYRNGKWRHDTNHKLTNKETEYLENNGWTIPKN